jgi:hypothetical protein
MNPSFVDRALPSTSLMLTIKIEQRVEGLPGVHLAYDQTRPFELTAGRVLDQGHNGPAWRLEDVVWYGLVFLVNYWAQRARWPAELRSACAGRTKSDAD